MCSVDGAGSGEAAVTGDVHRGDGHRGLLGVACTPSARVNASAVVTARAPARPAPVPLCQHSMVTPVSVLL